MAVDFPTGPTNGQLFTSPTGVNYLYGASAWRSQTSNGVYLDQAAGDIRYVNVTGDTMSGPLLLPAAAPTVGEHATNKTYVDGQVATKIDAATGDARWVNLTGDTMTGYLTINGSSSGLTVNGLQGIVVQGVAGTSTGMTYSPWLMIKSDWEQTYLQAWHQAGVAAGMYLGVGSGSTTKVWNFRHTGQLEAPGDISVPQNSKFRLGGLNSVAYLSQENSGAVVLYIAPGYYYNRGADGTWSWVENNTGNMTLTASGDLWVRRNASLSGNTYIGAHIYMNNGGLIDWGNNGSRLVRDGSGHFFIYARSDHRQYWDNNDGVWRWQRGGSFEATDMQLSPSGDLNVRNSMAAGGNINAGNDIYAAGALGTANTMTCYTSSSTVCNSGNFYTWGATFGTMSFSWNGDGTQSCNHIVGSPNYDNIYTQGFHQPNVTAQMRFWIGGVLFGMRNDGTAYAPGAWQDGCDERVKTDIQPITDAMSKVMQIEGVTYMRSDIGALYTPEMLEKYVRQADEAPTQYEYKNPTPARQAGFLAQSIKAVLPEAITIGETPPSIDPEGEGFNFLNSTAVLALVVQALKELAARVETLEDEVP